MSTTRGRRRRRRGHGGDRGSVTAEMVLITPLVLVLMQFLVFTGRGVDARSDVVSAARDAARAASIQRNAFAAEQIANQTVENTLEGEGIQCEGDPNVGISFSGPNGLGFVSGNFVHVEVECQIRLSDLAWLNLPGTMTSTHEAAEIIDVFRGA